MKQKLEQRKFKIYSRVQSPRVIIAASKIAAVMMYKDVFGENMLIYRVDEYIDGQWVYVPNIPSDSVQ